eukprot:scaffold50915_cov66-Phaeocystis_antarctica.AAC.8
MCVCAAAGGGEGGVGWWLGVWGGMEGVSWWDDVGDVRVVLRALGRRERTHISTPLSTVGTE